MRQLLPVPETPTSDRTTAVDPVAAYRADPRPGTSDRPWVAVNMVTSLDGATSIEGESAGLSHPTDKVVFRTLRSIADVILVGAGTWRAEGYRPPRTSEEDQAWRTSQGRPPHPRIAVVSGRLELDIDTPFFSQSPTRPLVVTTASSDPERRRGLAEVADVVIAGSEALDIADALRQLGTAGARVIVCEGGPTLNEALLAGSHIDEFCFTLAPILAGGTSDRAVTGSLGELAQHYRLDRALEDDSFLVLRYVRDR